MRKKVVLLYLLLIYFSSSTPADTLGNLLQDLAIQTASLGMYSSTQAAGDFVNRFNDPHDWYTPSFMASRFARRSGDLTRTITFYGVCFDYAQFAYDDIVRYQTAYNTAGMRGSEFYIAVTRHGNPNLIFLYKPVTPDRATRFLNGIPVREYAQHRIRAHDNASGHAWLWVQHNNGTWYWIDPTWTDNTGYPWWGIVQDGREVQYFPDPNLSLASNFPRPARSNETLAESNTRRPDSTYISSQGNPASFIGYNYVPDLPLGGTIANRIFLRKSLFYVSFNIGFDEVAIDGDRHTYRWDKTTIEWICGFSIALSDNFRIPIGIGGYYVLYERTLITQGYASLTWLPLPDPKDEGAFIFEIGVQPVLFNKLVLTATYRFRGPFDNDYALGFGIMF